MQHQRFSVEYHVAGITFVLRADEAIPPMGESTYQAFLRNAMVGPPGDTCTVRVVKGAMPGLNDAEQLFAAGKAWCMYTQDGQRFVVLPTPAATTTPTRIAVTENDGSNVTLHIAADQPVSFDLLRYPLDQILLTQLLATRRGVLVHAAGVEYDGSANLLIGKSGKGKSTISRLLDRQAGFRLINDDRIVVRIHGDQVRAYGTPWPGEMQVAQEACLPVRRLLFLRHAARHALHRLTPADVIERLLPTVSIPWYDAGQRDSVLGVCEQVAKEVPAWDLAFTPDEDVARFLEAAFAGEPIPVSRSLR